MLIPRLAIDAAKKVIGYSAYEVRQKRDCASWFFEEADKLRSFIRGKPPFVETFVQNILSSHHISSAQIFQDSFALAVANNRTGGFFVEFGVADPVKFNNSYALESRHDWNGIIAEPNRSYHKAMRARKCSIEKDCVWSSTGKTLSFAATAEGSLSTVAEFRSDDHHNRSDAETYDVTSISLHDMLTKHGAPKIIDYMSVDTEGSEFEILHAFDFSKYIFRALTIEHNYQASKREDIQNLMKKNGYVHVLSEISQFDDWFVHDTVLAPICSL